jgi:creatinase
MPLPFDPAEYDDRLTGLRDVIGLHGLDAVVLTSPRNIAYFCGVMADDPAPAACIVTATECVTVLPAGFGPDGLWRAIAAVTGTGRAVGCEADHLTMVQADMLNGILRPKRGMDISPATMAQRLVKSDAEQALMRHAAGVADLGAGVILDALRQGATGPDAAHVGHRAMQDDLARRFPEAAQTHARARLGPLLRGVPAQMTLTATIHGYTAPLTRIVCTGTPDEATLAAWQSLAEQRESALSLLQPGTTCAAVAAALDAASPALHGRAAGLAMPGDAPDSGLDLRAGVDTVLDAGMVVTLRTCLEMPPDRSGHVIPCDQDLVVLSEDGPEIISRFPVGPRNAIP